MVYGSFRIDPLDHLFFQYSFPILPVSVSQVAFHSDVCWGRICNFEDTENRKVSPVGVPS